VIGRRIGSRVNRVNAFRDGILGSPGMSFSHPVARRRVRMGEAMGTKLGSMRTPAVSNWLCSDRT